MELFYNRQIIHECCCFVSAFYSSCDSSCSESEISVPWATIKEKYLKGLKHWRKNSLRNVEVGYVEDLGFATRDFIVGDFVCEYMGTVQTVEMIRVILATRNCRQAVTVLIWPLVGKHMSLMSPVSPAILSAALIMLEGTITYRWSPLLL